MGVQGNKPGWIGIGGIALIIGVIFFSGCGRKGSLIAPEDVPKKESPATPADRS